MRQSANQRLIRAAAILLGVYVLEKLGLLVWLSQQTAYVMDEYRHASFSYYIDELYRTFTPLKTALFIPFYRIAYWLADDAVGVMRAARSLTACVAISITVGVYVISRNLGRGRIESLINVAVLLAFSTFMERAFRVRSEPLAVLFAVLSLAVLTRETMRRPSLQMAIGGILAGMAFLTTQKTVYLVFAFGVGIIAQVPDPRRVRETALRLATYASGWAAALLVYAVYFKGIHFTELLRHIFVGPVDLALHGHEVYANFDRYVWQTLLRNPGAYAVCVAGLLAAIVAFARQRPTRGHRHRRVIHIGIHSQATVAVRVHHGAPVLESVGERRP